MRQKEESEMKTLEQPDRTPTLTSLQKPLVEEEEEAKEVESLR